MKKLCDELRGEQPPAAAAAAMDGTPPSGGSSVVVRLEDRILAVLGRAENPMDAEAIFEAVTRPERGLYAPA